MKALIALGSNLGASESVIHEAWKALEALALGPVKRSSLWRSSPVDCPPGSPDYLNAAASLLVAESAQAPDFLKSLLALEHRLGRTRSGLRNEPRVLDLDLICFGDQVHQTERLTLPHPRAHQRRFVLAPLAEIEPDFILPRLGLSVQTLLDQLDDTDTCEIWHP